MENVIFKDMTPEQRAEIVEAIVAGQEAQFFTQDTWVDAMMPSAIYLHLCYRLKPRKLEIPWHVIKPEYKFAAMDSNGIVFAYTQKPEISELTFCSEEDGSYCCVNGVIDIDTTGIDWRESLVERPEGE